MSTRTCGLACAAGALWVAGALAAAPPPAAITLQRAAGHPMHYHLALPSGWTRERSWPVVVVIPDATRNFAHNLRAFVAVRGDRPFILVAPEVLSCGGARSRTADHYSYAPAEWDSIGAGDDFAFDDAGLAAVLADVRERWHGEAKAFLTGWEAGGHTVWAQAFRRPERWRAVAPVSTNYLGRGIDPTTFSRATGRATLPIQVFRCGAPTGEAVAGIGFFDQQTARALAEARVHGFAPLPVHVVPDADHGPLPGPVLDWFESLAAGTTDTLTVVTLNLWNDQNDWPKRLNVIVAELRRIRPDVLCLQEVLQNPVLRNQAETLGDSLGHHVQFASVDGPERPKRYGNAILTPHRVLVGDSRALEPANDYRAVAHVRFEWRGHAIDAYSTHLHHTLEGGAIRAEQIRHLLAYADSTRGKGPIVIAGDFNCELGTPELAPVTAGHLDVFHAVHPGASRLEAATYNDRFGVDPGAIDHIFVERQTPQRLEPLACDVIFRTPGPDSVWASDHFGLVAKLGLRK